MTTSMHDASTKREASLPDSDTLFIGIDLGTSQSAVATSSGRLINVASVAGFPKDLVSFKLLRKSVIYGDECYKNRMSLDLFYPLEKGVIAIHRRHKDASRQKEAIKGFITHLISLAEKHKDQKVYVVVGAPAQSTAEDRQAVVKSLEDMVNAVLVVSEPFLVSYGMGLFGFGIIVDIGAGTLDICRMHGSIPEEADQHTFFKAGTHIDKVFLDLLKSRLPNAKLNPFLLRKVKERSASVEKKPDPVPLELPVSGKLVKYDVTGELVEACRTIVPDIVKTVRDLIINFDQEYQQKLRENIILAGCGSRIRGLAKVLENELSDVGKITVKSVEDPVFAGAVGGLKLARDMPLEEWNRI